MSFGFSISRLSARSGFGSVLAIGGNYYRFDLALSPHSADRAALSSDWKAIGNDFHACMTANPAKTGPLKPNNGEKKHR